MMYSVFRRHRWAVAAQALALLAAGCGGGDGTQPGVADANQAAEAVTAQAKAAAAEVELVAVQATASSAERGDLSAAAAIDKNPATRWGSSFSDNQFLVLDFGKTVAIDRVRIQWEAAYASSYLLQVSNDQVNWTTVKAVTSGQGGVEDWSGLAASGRYLRMQGVKRSGGYGYSIYEISVFSGGPVVPVPTPVPTTPTDPTLPPDVLTRPGALIRPVAVTASSAENGGTAAAMAVDGNTSTRWASKFEDNSWIQFDFGQVVYVGAMKLVWENAYAKEYVIETSDDGASWAPLRYVGKGTGGTEEFLNLGAKTRFVRIRGVARATQYGYSLFEVEFKAPGSDNTIAPVNPVALTFPANGAGLVPLPKAQEPLETLQFKLADGTLVTRFGARAMGRHGRERGEEWNEVGYGPNETVDAATGAPRDKGPGAYLPFVPQYFKNRTWGLEILDNSRVPGVTKPTLQVNQFNTVDFLVGGIAFFRGFDRVGVTGYGWMNPGEVVGNPSICPPMPYPANGKLGNPICSLLIKNYPGHSALDADGFPNGKNVPARSLVVGDVIEVAPSMFSTREAMAARGDDGGIRYYSGEWVYVVGTGLVPWYGVQPRLNSVPLPADTLTGGLGSVSYNYSDNGDQMFQQPQNHTGMQNMQRFVEGRRIIHTNFTTGDHNEPGNDRYAAAVGLQGTRFNQSACIACHVNNGRSPAPIAANQRLDQMAIRTASLGANGQQLTHPVYGAAIQMNAVTAGGSKRDWGNGVRVSGFQKRTVRLADGLVVELSKPTLAFDGPVPEVYSLRAAQPMLGGGLLEAIPEADVLARVRSAPDEDGVKGVANFVLDPETGETRLGRFGWKASKASLRHQAAAALVLDMSVTSPVYPQRTCVGGAATCKSGAAERGISEAELQSISNYLALVAVPAQRSLPSGFPKGVAPLDEHRVDSAQVALGSKIFQSMRCTACHAPEAKTGSGHLLAELRGQTIRPYTDLLLHDMGADLADRYAEGQAQGAMWRTAPLWGVGYSDKVMGNGGKAGYLHDGRARTLTEAILWHGGEAERARQRFEKLGTADREALLAFLRSL